MELHRCRFVNYVPSAINCLALTPNTYKPYTLLACGRENGDIDIWDPKEGWFLKKVYTHLFKNENLKKYFN